MIRPSAFHQACFCIFFGWAAFCSTGAGAQALSQEEAQLEQKAFYALNNGDIPVAQATFTELVRSYPNRPDHYTNLGLLLIQTNQVDKAVLVLQRGLRSHKKSPKLLANLAIAYVAKEDYKRAEAYFKRALHYDPDNPAIYSNLGSLYMETQQYKMSSQSFNRTLKLDPKNVKAYVNRGLLFAKLANLATDPEVKKELSQQAGRDWQTAVALDPSTLAYLKKISELNQLHVVFRPVSSPAR